MGNGHTDLIIIRDLTAPIDPPNWPPGFELVRVTTTADPLYPSLNACCDTCGFPAGWVARMLDGGARGWAIVTHDNSSPERIVIGTGWMTSEPFYVEEVGWTFNPGSDGVYVFGDFILEAWRGRGLQKQMLRERLVHEASTGARWVYGIAKWNNAASLTSCSAAGFVVAARIGVRFLGPIRVERLKRPAPALPMGHSSRKGIRLPLGFRLRWQ